MTTSTRRPRARKGDGELLRDEILAAAERLLIRAGDQDAVSVRAIAEAVGVTPPAIFGIEHPEAYRILFMSRPSAVPSAWTPETTLDNAAFRHHLEAVQRAFPTVADPYLVAIGLWASVHGVVSLLIAQPDFPWPDVEALVDHMLAAQARGIAST